MQHLVRVDGQQRHHAAQQYGKQIERNRAQHHGAAKDKADACTKALPDGVAAWLDGRLGGFVALGGIPHLHAGHQYGAQGQRRHADAIRPLRAASSIQKAAQHRRANCGAAYHHAVGGNGLWQQGLRHQLRQQALHGRAGESTRCPKQHQHRINTGNARMPVARQPQQQAAAQCANGPAGRQNVLAWQAVNQIASGQQQKQHG